MADAHPLQRIGVPQRVSILIRPLLWPLVLIAALMAALAGIAIVADRERHREREAGRLEAIAGLRAGQVSNWLRERTVQARFAGDSPLGELYLRWRETGDTAARDRLFGRLSSFHKASGGHSVLVVDDQGSVVAGDPPTTEPTPPELRAAARLAIERNAPQFTYLYGYDAAAPAPRIDVVAPLTLTGKPARAAIVLRLDPKDSLFPLLNQWPLPSQTAAALLIRREGTDLVGPLGRTRVPLSTPGLLAAKVLRGEAPQAKALDALDFRGQAVLGAVYPVEGTEWYLVAKIDHAEAYAEARRNAWWIGAAGVLAWLAMAAAAYWLRERQALLLASVQRTHQEEKLRALGLLDAIAQGSTDAIFAKDRDKRYILCNDEACRIIGKPREDILGKDDFAIFPQQAGELIANDARVMELGRTMTYEVELSTVRGLSTYLTTKGPLRDAQGRVTGVFGISRDITERTRTSAELDRHRHHLEDLVRERTAALERTVRDLEAFGASVSHDLRAPLRTVSGFATVLERSEGAKLSAEGRRKLQRIVAGAAAMDRMIEDMLRCSRAEQVELSFGQVDLDLLVREIAFELAASAPAAQVVVGALPVVRADPGMARQIFVNLIGNALKFSARQAQPRVEIGVDGSGPQACLFVQDNGVGFDAALAGKLFAPFQRLHKEEDYPGTGVGLSIVKRLIERHGGSISAESVPGRTVFRFSFGPNDRPAANASAPWGGGAEESAHQV